MIELWLKFNDENDEPRSVRVDRENFVIGRSPENDLSIPINQLSRVHAEINRFSDTFVIADCNSSNGTTLNGQTLRNPIALKNGDRINFGGGLEATVELVDANVKPPPPALDSPADSTSAVSEIPLENEIGGAAGMESPDAPVPANAELHASKPQSQGSIARSFFIIAPILGVIMLLFAGGLLLLFAGRAEKKPTVSDDDYVYSTERSSESKSKTKTEDEEDETPTPKTKETPSSTETPISSTVATSSTPVPVSNDLDKIDRNALSFMRRIAINDNKYVFTQKQLGEINNQIKAFKGSASLRENLKAVKKDASKFEELAKTKGLKPQFLATAALAKIGNQTQNPLTVAQTMLPVLGELRITLNNELADDNLLVIAAYDLGEQGKFRAMQSTLEALTKQTAGVSPETIRTIWFLREKGKLTDAQYAFALRFLAIGAITQNPKDFNVETEAVVFN